MKELKVPDLIINTLLRTNDRIEALAIITSQLGPQFHSFFTGGQAEIIGLIAETPELGTDHLIRAISANSRNYLNDLNSASTDPFGSIDQLASDCKELKAEFLARNFSETLATNAEKLRSGQIDYQVAVDNVEYARQQAASLQSGFSRFISMEDLAAETEAEYRAILSGDISGIAIPTGLDAIDAQIMGLPIGGSLALMGATGDNKSLICGQIAVNVAKRGHRVLMYPLEMSPWAVQDRMQTNQSGIRIDDFVNRPTQKKFDNSLSALGSIKGLPITFANGGLSLESLQSDLNAIYVQGGVDVVVIDFLRLMGGDSKKSEAIRTENLAYGIQAIAQNYRNPDGSKITFLLATEYSRDISRRENPLPEKKDVKYGGDFAFSVMLGIVRPYTVNSNGIIKNICLDQGIIPNRSANPKDYLKASDRWIRVVKARKGKDGKIITSYRLHSEKGILYEPE